jgi:hypothetical protein
MKEITKKILIINQLLLPDELIDIIKNYVFYNIIDETKKGKNKIISLFNNNNIYYSKNETLINPDFPYPILYMNNKKTDIQLYFMLTYCETCGKYIRLEHLITYINNNLHCEC